MLEFVDLFGINHPDLNNDVKKKELLQKVLENPRFKGEAMGNVIYMERQIMGYVFVFDLSDPATLTDV